MSFSLPPLRIKRQTATFISRMLRGRTSPQRWCGLDGGGNDQIDEDMEDLEIWLAEFYEEHGREPYSSHEFFHWYNDRILQLEAKGLEFRDGKILPKAPDNR